MKHYLFIHIGVEKAFSGQAVAAELVCRQLEAVGHKVTRRLLPHLDRTVHGVSRYLQFFLRLVGSYIGILKSKRRPYAVVCLSLGQTRFAMIRDYIALRLSLIRMGKLKANVVITLNGHVFSQWSWGSLNARIFRFCCSCADTITCVGEYQKELLIELGVEERRIRIIHNTCSYSAITSESLVKKQQRGEPLRVLMLSTLYDSKGYVEYLEGLYLLSQKSGIANRVSAVLCGPVVVSEYDQHFSSAEEGKEWIRSMTLKINRSEYVELLWVPGAQSLEKKRLYEDAQVFVLPTRYPVEAQPLVVLEAMSQACALITSKAGELPSTIDTECAILLDPPSAENVANAIHKLVEDPTLMSLCAEAAWKKFKSSYTIEKNFAKWRQLLGA